MSLDPTGPFAWTIRHRGIDWPCRTRLAQIIAATIRALAEKETDNG